MRDSLIRQISRISVWLGASLLIVNFLVVMYGVITRYWLGGAPIWTDELARFTLVAAAMLAGAGVWASGEHMRVSLAERFLPTHWARWVILYQWGLCLFLCLAGLWISARYAFSVSLFRSQGLGISRTIPMLSMPAGFFLLSLMLIVRGPRPLPQQQGDPPC